MFWGCPQGPAQALLAAHWGKLVGTAWVGTISGEETTWYPSKDLAIRKGVVNGNRRAFFRKRGKKIEA